MDFRFNDIKHLVLVTSFRLSNLNYFTRPKSKNSRLIDLEILIYIDQKDAQLYARNTFVILFEAKSQAHRNSSLINSP